MINNRQNGRRRGRGGNNNNPRQGGGGGGGRTDSANRIDSRARGNANQLYEKYKNLARDAQMSGDRVNIEYYLQFADHYFRVLADTRSRTEDNHQPRRQQPFDLNGDDDDDNNEGEPTRSGEQNGRDDRGNRDNGRDTGRDSERDSNRGNRDGGRDSGRDRDNDRDTRSQRRDRDDTPRDNARDNNARDNNVRGEGDSNERPQRPRRERALRTEREDVGPVEHAASTSPENTAPSNDDEAPAPRRRGRPRKEIVAALSSAT
ncbi:MAG: DUF4167 domain-containing protein, partial [Sphingomonas bacterium]|nr:DUF4167 domain-containing protein [Sphingomonas bacterium]